MDGWLGHERAARARTPMAAMATARLCCGSMDPQDPPSTWLARLWPPARSPSPGATGVSREAAAPLQRAAAPGPAAPRAPRRAAAEAAPELRAAQFALLPDAAAFVAAIAAALPAGWQLASVQWTRNRSTMLSYRREHRCVALRLHRLFARAGAEEAAAIAAYISSTGRRRRNALDAFIAAHAPQAAAAAPARNVALRARGATHDLAAIFAAVNAAHFHSSCSATIGWGRANAPHRRRRSMQLGSYTQATHTIRIHPALDQPFVPEYMVAAVVFHEMLHEVFGLDERSAGGRRRLHPPEFLELERGFPEHARAQAWERAHIGRLLAYRG